MMMHLVKRASLALALGMSALVAGGSSADAAFVTGSINLSGFANLTPSTLSSATTFRFFTTTAGVTELDRLRIGSADGSFAAITPGTLATVSQLILGAATGTTAGSFTLQIPGDGVFTVNQPVQQNTTMIGTATFRNILLTGVINSGGDLSNATLSVTLTQQNGVGPASVAADLVATGVIPEPASMAMLAMGGLGMMGAARRRNRKA